jgi:hypothetical protein
MDIPADTVPPELKPACEQILRRARELRKADPIMSYWCKCSSIPFFLLSLMPAFSLRLFFCSLGEYEITD